MKPPILAAIMLAVTAPWSHDHIARIGSGGKMTSSGNRRNLNHVQFTCFAPRPKLVGGCSTHRDVDQFGEGSSYRDDAESLYRIRHRNVCRRSARRSWQHRRADDD